MRYAHDTTSAMKSFKQRVSSMLLRYGWVWNERAATGNLKATWTRGYVRWTKSAIVLKRRK